MKCLACRLGLVEYPDALALQKELASLRAQEAIGDVLLLLEHPPVFTLGASAQPHNLLVRREFLAVQGIGVADTDRGGDITYHGPGQLVAYPILKLSALGLDPHQYVRRLEEVAITTLAHFDVTAGRVPGCPGVWVGQEKVCAIGIRIAQGVSYHGFALNCDNDLAPFSYIHPCGIQDKGVSSLTRLLGRRITIAQVIPYLLKDFSLKLGIELQETPIGALSYYGETAQVPKAGHHVMGQEIITTLHSPVSADGIQQNRRGEGELLNERLICVPDIFP